VGRRAEAVAAELDERDRQPEYGELGHYDPEYGELGHYDWVVVRRLGRRI
jgi:hypothetical protein